MLFLFLFFKGQKEGVLCSFSAPVNVTYAGHLLARAPLKNMHRQAAHICLSVLALFLVNLCLFQIHKSSVGTERGGGCERKVRERLSQALLRPTYIMTRNSLISLSHLFFSSA